MLLALEKKQTTEKEIRATLEESPERVVKNIS